jgi:hypothetical protein
MRRAIAFVAVGAFIGLLVWRADYDPRDGGALTIAAVTELLFGVATASTRKPAKATPTTERSSLPPAAAETKAESSQPEIAKTTGAHQPRSLRAANEKPS